MISQLSIRIKLRRVYSQLSFKGTSSTARAGLYLGVFRLTLAHQNFDCAAKSKYELNFVGYVGT